MIVRNDVWTKFAYLNVVSETRSRNKVFSFHWKLITHGNDKTGPEQKSLARQDVGKYMIPV